MTSPLVIDEVVFSSKSSLVAMAGWYRTNVSLRTVDFSFVAFKTSFVAEALLFAGRVHTNIWTIVLILVLPVRF